MQPEVILFSPEGFCCNCYALISGNEIALVDVGQISKPLRLFLEQNKSKVKYILQTHCHYDHIMGLGEALSLTNAKLVIHADEAEGLKNGDINLCSHVGLPQPQLSPDILVHDGSTLAFGEGEIKVMHTPGHTVGSAVYIMGDALFTGDTLFAQGAGRTDLPGGNTRKLLKSLGRLRALEENYRIFPGHENETTMEFEKKYNHYLNLKNIT